MILSALLMFKPLGMMGVWLAFPVGYALSLVFVLVVAWRANHKFPRNISGCFLPFPVAKFREASYSCDTPKQLAKTSESLSNALLDWGGGQSACNKAALCVEEYGILLMSKSFH